MAAVGKCDVIGIGISATDYAGACETIMQAASLRRPLAVTALAVHGVMSGVLNREHRQRLNTLDLVLPDGQPVRWALNLLHRVSLPDRVYGPTLMLRLCEAAANRGLSVGLYGSKPEVLEDLHRNIQAHFPTLRVPMMMPSRFRRVGPEEQADLARQISASGADLLFVGLGCPRQEVWVYENRAHLGIPMVAVGAAFDFHAKRLAQAPGWMQDRGLEWVFRLWHEPRRLWRRYVLLNPLFVSLLALQLFGLCLIRSRDQDEVPYEGYA